ncbi:MAG: hypothetical protein R3C19_08730 [Planctomycetaceae bacterium]
MKTTSLLSRVVVGTAAVLLSVMVSSGAWAQATTAKPDKQGEKLTEKVKAHQEGPPPAVGEIVSLTSDAIGIKDHAGKEHKFKVDAHTKYGTAAHPLKWNNFKKGEHVMVTYHGSEALVIAEVPPHGHTLANATKSHEEGTPPVAGEVVSISKDAIEIKDHAGKDHKFKIDATTKFGTIKEPLKLDHFKTGEHVLVNYKNDVATIVRDAPAHGHGHIDALTKGKGKAPVS